VIPPVVIPPVALPPWLDKPLSEAITIHRQGRLPHAILIRAVEGWGEVALAERLALILIGKPDVAEARTLAHPDLRWVEPEGSIIKVDEIRLLAHFAIGTRQSAACKVAVVESAHLMNLSAANALLKTLEEPPSDTYLILTTSRPARLLPTIISRCQTLKIESDARAAHAWLLEKWEAGQIEEKLFEYDGAPLAVHRALTDAEPPLAPLLVALARQTPASTRIGGMLEWDPDRLTSGWYRHCAALLASRSRLPGVNEVNQSALFRFIDELNAVRYQLLFTNSANQRLLYERLVVKWQALIGQDVQAP